MRKYSKMLLFAILAVALMASSALAGTIVFQGNGTIAAGVNVPFTVALEAMGAARNYTMPGSASGQGNNAGFLNAAIRITPGQTLPSGTLLTVSFTNAGFDGSAVHVCQADSDILAANMIASATTTANANSQAFVIGSSTLATQTLFLTTAGVNCNGTNGSNGAFIIRFQPVSSAAMVSMSYTASLSGTTFDSGTASNNVANISSQFATSYGQLNSSIDFAANSTSNGIYFTGGANNYTIGGNANIAFTGMNLNAAGAAAPHAGLTVSAILSLQDSASWQDVNKIYVSGTSTACSGAALTGNNAIATTLSGTVNLSIPSNAFNGSATYAGTVCAETKGNAVIQARTIKGGYAISVSSGGVSPAADTLTSIMSWMSNGYQGIIPYISASSTYSTLCFIDNKSNLSAPVTVDIISAESGATLTSLQALSAGTVGAGKTMRVDIDSSIHPYTYSGGTETAGTTVPLTGVQSNDRLAAMINVGGNPTQIVVSCLQLDPAGSKRAVPVLTQSTTTVPWMQ